MLVIKYNEIIIYNFWIYCDRKITLTNNPDIIKNICLKKNKRPQLVIGFALETKNLVTNALKKIKIKGCDWIVANELNKQNKVFGSDFNKIVIIKKNEIKKFKKMTKINIAKKLVNEIYIYFNNKKLKIIED